MNIFGQIMSKLFGKTKDMEGPIPGAQGRILASMGIHEIGPHIRKGTPLSVLNGCRKELVVVPGSDRPAFTKEGKPVLAKDKHGRTYQVTDQYAVPVKRWKQMLRDEERKASGRAFNGETDAQRDARRAKRKAA